MVDPSDPTAFIFLYKRNLIPLYVVLCSLVWVLHDYFITLEDEVTYIWKQSHNFARFMFFWIRYYTIVLLIFEVVQTYSLTLPGARTRERCLAAYLAVRIVGAISLWSVEIIMQLRIYALFNRSKKVAFFNGILFLISIGLFLRILVVNTSRRTDTIEPFIRLPLPGCPLVSCSGHWTLWIPATVYEFFLFGLALYKAATSSTAGIKLNHRPSLMAVLLQENLLYFLVIGCILTFNNIMVVGATRIPWFGFGPFHASIGIATSRMFIHLRKFSTEGMEGESALSPEEIRFVDPAPSIA